MLTVAGCTINTSRFNYCTNKLVIVHFELMVSFAPRLLSRSLALPIIVVIVAMLMRAWVPQGYMPAQPSTYSALTFCSVGLSSYQQKVLGLSGSSESGGHFDDTQHCLLSAQFQSAWLKAGAVSLSLALLLPVIRLPWVPAARPVYRPDSYSSLWARAPPR